MPNINPTTLLGFLIAIGSPGRLCAESVSLPPTYGDAAPFDGVTLVSPNASTTTFTIDLDGNTLQTWQGAARPGSIAYLLPDGSLVRPCRVTICRRQRYRNCFLKTGDDFVALFKNRKPGLNHFCFTWPGKTAHEAVTRLESVGIASRREENRVYFKDPDGLTVQVAGENDWNDWR